MRKLPLLLCLLATPAAAQDPAEGLALYMDYCATCHGLEARGDGPMAPSMMLQPPDLTTLKARNQGVMPIIRIVTRIDGRDPLVSHGSPMPIYGDFFEGRDVAIKAETGQPIMTSQPIVDLLVFLEGVQEEAIQYQIKDLAAPDPPPGRARHAHPRSGAGPAIGLT